MNDYQLTEKIIFSAIEVHKYIRPGLLESVYENCLAKEFEIQGLKYIRQKSISLKYKGFDLEQSYRLDFLVENEVIVEIKSVELIHSIHIAQMITYLKLIKKKTGLILNFNSSLLKDGIKRIVL